MLGAIVYTIHIPVNCGLGTYYASTTGTCINCPKGQFTDTDGQTECEPCPAGTITQYPGTDDMTLCLSKLDDCFVYLYEITCFEGQELLYSLPCIKPKRARCDCLEYQTFFILLGCNQF